MKEFKIGGKITVSQNESYIIINIIKKDEKKYYICSTYTKPVKPKVFERIEKNGKIFIKVVDDPKILKEIAEKILSENK